MIKIGIFSKISQVSIKTLRYYDEMGLLKPVAVDRYTSYRYYEMSQLHRLYQILALKDLGFSLDEVGRLLSQEISNAELRGMLRMKREELRRTVQVETERLERVDARLRQLEQETKVMGANVVLKKIDPLLVAGARGIISTYSEQGRLWDTLGSALQQKGITPVGACFTLYHNDEPEIDAEVCEPVSGPVVLSSDVKVHELPAIDQAACLVHQGSFSTLGEAYNGLMQWIEQNGYRICGPIREIYLRPPDQPGDQEAPETVTEIQAPVMKA